MKYILLAIIFFSSFVIGKDTAKFPSYNLGGVEADFHQNVNNHLYEFLSVCGISCEVPGVEGLEISYCYRKFTKVKIIDNTGDAISSNEQAVFKRASREYANSYNQLLLKYLQENNMTSCQPNENWTSAWEEVNSYLIKHDNELAYITAPPTRGGVFSIYLRGKLKAKPLMGKACSVFSNRGINGRVQFLVSKTAKLNETWKTTMLYKFSCLNGKSEVL